MYSCTMPNPGKGGGGWGYMTPPPEKAVGVLKIAHYMILRVYGNGLFDLVEVWGGLGYFGVFFFFFNGPHDGYANS